MAAGQTCLVMSYSGDVIQASNRAAEAKQEAVSYVAPKEFTQLWFDMLAIPKDAPHPELALQFIGFILQPSVIAGVTNTVQYPNAVPASKPMVNAAVRDNPNVYPDRGGARPVVHRRRGEGGRREGTHADVGAVQGRHC